MLEQVFKLSENKTNVRTEILAGVTTFLAMAYILFVNPSILRRDWHGQGCGVRRRPAWQPPSVPP